MFCGIIHVPVRGGAFSVFKGHHRLQNKCSNISTESICDSFSKLERVFSVLLFVP